MKRFAGLLGEAMRIAVAQPVATAVTVLIVAAVCGVIVSTTGQTVAIERDVLQLIDDAGTRTIVVEDTQGRAGIDAQALRRIEAVDGAEWAIGFGIARDVRPAGVAGAAAVAMRAYFGNLPEAVATSTWDARPGTALAGPGAIDSLGFETAAGPVELVAGGRSEIGVVGWLRAEEPIAFLNDTLLTVPRDEDFVVRIYVLADSGEMVPRLASSVGSVLDPEDPTSVAIQTSETLVQVRQAVEGQLGTWGRDLVVIVLAAGLVLSALNVFSAVTARRRDFGRRRALGASRLDIVVLVTTQTVATAIPGAVFGAAVGTVVVHQTLQTAPRADFVVAVGILAVLATALAALPPAVIAAYRDSVRILRVP